MTAASLSPDKALLVTAGSKQDGRIAAWDLASGKRLAYEPIPVHEESMTKEGVFVRELVFSNDGQLFATAGSGTPICVWRIERLP